MNGRALPHPVFVLAGPRSYSSLVVGMIGRHPDLYGMPELNLFQCANIKEFNTGENADGSIKSPFWKSMRHGLLRAVAQIYSAEQTPESIRMAERWLRMREPMTSGEVFRELCEAVAPLRVVEKSPGILRRQEFMNRMLAAFPEARFIHLVRNPIDQCKSTLAAKGGVGLLLSLNAVDYRGEEARLEPQILWHDMQIQILRFLDQLPSARFITLRGEDVLNKTDAVLRALCKWLGVSDAPEAIEAMKHPENSLFASIGPPNARLGNDVNFLKAPALREDKVTPAPLDAELPWREDGEKLHPRVVALAKALGYTKMPGLKPLRAKEHRSFIGPEFGAGPDGANPQTLNYLDLMADPKSAGLARKVFEELREQFAQPEATATPSKTPEAEEYRAKLVGWADMLEILLEETLKELEAMDAQRRAPATET